jgi:phosphatidylglycerol:prolipoprotein diacylglycerol transferase
MWPYFSILGFYFPAYNLVLALGLLAALLVLFFAARRKRMALSFLADHFALFAFVAALAGRMTEIALHGYAPSEWLFFWRDTGFSFFGSVTGLLLILFWVVRRHGEDFFAWLDLAALSTAVLLAFHHLGTLLAGTDYGAPTDSFLQFTFSNPDSAAPLGLPLHPTQFYALALTLLFFLLGAFVFKRTRLTGKTGALLIFTLALGSFGLDFLRGDSAQLFFALRASQYFALFFAVIAAGFYYRIKHAAHPARTEEFHLNANQQ